MNVGKSVFVIMPFSSTKNHTEDEWTEIYEDVFKHAIKDCGYTCERAMPETGSLIRSIVEKLKGAHIVLADITDWNPNVFYELGVRHTLSKRTIIVSQDTDAIPSDLRGYWSLRYGTRPSEVTKFKREIRRIVSEIEKHPDQSDNPVSDYLEREQLSISSHVQRENIKKLGALYTELTGNSNCLTELLSERVAIEAISLVTYECLKLLLQTLYIDIGPEFLRQAYELFMLIKSIEAGCREKKIIKLALQYINSLSPAILEIRNKLIRGEYQEPSVVTTMVWARLIDGRVAHFHEVCHTLRDLTHRPSGECAASSLFWQSVLLAKDKNSCKHFLTCVAEADPIKEITDKSKSTRAKTAKAKGKGKNLRPSIRGPKGMRGRKGR